jgi:hypothetical protein
MCRFPPSTGRPLTKVSGIAAFVLLATMNAAGYRYAASDQAFYIPAVVRQLDPSLFPSSGSLIDSQARLTVIDELAAGIVRATGLSLQHLFLLLYVMTLVLMVAGAARIGERLYRTGWAVAALGAALTLRHAIAKTGANTLEGYFHPRQLAFALGLWAAAMLLERRDRLGVILLAAAAAIHSTTALWFVVWLTAALFVDRPSWRRGILGFVAAAGVAAAVLLWRGPLAGHLTIIDAAWLDAIGEKDLYPLAWTPDAWFTNLVAVPIVLWCWRARHRAGLTISGESALALGAMALPLLFLCWLPFNAAHVALAVQLQASRVFWLLDVLATIYLVWWLAEGTGAAPRLSKRAATVAVLVLAASIARGAYTMFMQFPDRRIFAVDVQHQDWREAMTFARTTDPRTTWLADPIHAAKYGSSLRASGHRDVLLEALKDRAIAMYDREVAMQVADRMRSLQDAPWDTADGARELARRYNLDYLVIDRQLALPLAHQSGTLFIYRLR